jgi:hypothetical protein
MIFFTATGCWVSWSLAELYDSISILFKIVGVTSKYQTRPNAPMPTGCRSVYLIDSQLGKPGIVSQYLWSYLLVISKVVPKIWARTNSAMVNVGS